jgi:hypothetical protein
MDNLGQIAFLALASITVFLIAGYLGFLVPAPLRRPSQNEDTEVERIELPAGLPSAARRWLAGSGAEFPAPDNIIAWGRGRIASKVPIIGRIWLPFSWQLTIQPNAGFVLQNRVTWFGRKFIRGGESFRDGKGAFMMGTENLENTYLDDTERTLGWFYTMWLAPGMLVKNSCVSFLEKGSDHLEIRVAEPDKPQLTLDLSFSSTTGSLTSFTSTRIGSRSGTDYPYVGTFSKPSSFGAGNLIPTRFIANWDNDVYLKMELAGSRYNQDISEIMEAGVEGLPG